jgi:hypothetical protein
LPGLGGDDVGRERRALLFAYEFIRHSDKRQLLEVHETHAATYKMLSRVEEKSREFVEKSSEPYAKA